MHSFWTGPKAGKLFCMASVHCDRWLIKLWVIAKYPEVVFATYQSEKETDELKKIDKVVSSFTFVDA